VIDRRCWPAILLRLWAGDSARTYAPFRLFNRVVSHPPMSNTVAGDSYDRPSPSSCRVSRLIRAACNASTFGHAVPGLSVSAFNVVGGRRSARRPRSCIEAPAPAPPPRLNNHDVQHKSTQRILVRFPVRPFTTYHSEPYVSTQPQPLTLRVGKFGPFRVRKGPRFAVRAAMRER